MRPQKPIVGILMGSESDMMVMQSAAETLDRFGISYELVITSAHRSPHQTLAYATKAEKRGIKLIIAGAGGAAHLPGVVAAWSTIPVIGIPIRTRAFKGVDSFISMVEMPKGVPVATVGVDNANNAALLAVSILAINDKGIKSKLKKYRQDLAKKVTNSNNKNRI
ncbi:MAG: 5-(carboxyamino)imidazole ribonucleotide mutase [bacterium]